MSEEERNTTKRVRNQTIFFGINENPKNTGVSGDTKQSVAHGSKDRQIPRLVEKDQLRAKGPSTESVTTGSTLVKPQQVHQEAKGPKKEGVTEELVPVTSQRSTSRALLRSSLVRTCLSLVRTPY